MGRARPRAHAGRDVAGAATGSVVELDHEVDDPVQLYVDGMCFATGRLLVGEDGGLQLKVETVSGLHGAAPADA